jgi:SAM-dependent methyltransferase
MTLESDLATTGIEQVPLCNICGSNGESDPRWADLLGLPARYGVLRCIPCGLRWLSPRPAADALEVIYSAEHYFGQGDTGYAQFAALRLDEFRSRVEAMLASGAQSVLDYGAATGEFTGIAASQGMRAVGIEFSRAARSEAARRGIELLAPGTEVGEFDVIHMNHVLEHLPDPSEHLRWCLEHLAPNGMLWIEVPFQFDNDLDRLRRLAGRWHPSFNAFSLHHTYFFSQRSLRRICDQANLSIEALRQPFMPAPWRSSGLMGLFIAIASLRGNGDALVLKARRATR